MLPWFMNDDDSVIFEMSFSHVLFLVKLWRISTLKNNNLKQDWLSFNNLQ